MRLLPHAAGIRLKASMTGAFLERKMAEYNARRSEITTLRAEFWQAGSLLQAGREKRMNAVTPVILCGGSGIRLWSLSHKSFSSPGGALGGGEGTAEVTPAARLFPVSRRTNLHRSHCGGHRLRNPGKMELEMIEVQSGSCVGEHDIVRPEVSHGWVP